MLRALSAAAVLAIAIAIPANAAERPDGTPNNGNGQDRLMIVNGNNGRVVYDDGRDDLYCVTRRVVVGYNDYGRPIVRRNMRCR